MSHDFRKVDELAKMICEARNGKGAWIENGVHRNHWRRLAITLIENEPRIFSILSIITGDV